MSKSPGHQQHPEHKVLEHHLGRSMQAAIDGEVVAASDDVIEVDEDGHPARFYFPRSDVKMEDFEPTQTTTRCPFKGTAHYFSLHAGGQDLPDSAWSYEEPYDEHAELKGRIAFYDDKYNAIRVSPAP